jgi:hypothetical protein
MIFSCRIRFHSESLCLQSLVHTTGSQVSREVFLVVNVQVANFRRTQAPVSALHVLLAVHKPLRAKQCVFSALKDTTAVGQDRHRVPNATQVLSLPTQAQQFVIIALEENFSLQQRPTFVPIVRKELTQAQIAL